MSSKPKFRIIESRTVRCPSRDGIIGSARSVLRYCETEAYAHKLVAVMDDGDDERSHHVQTTDAESLFMGRILIPVAAADDMPF